MVINNRLTKRPHIEYILQIDNIRLFLKENTAIVS